MFYSLTGTLIYSDPYTAVVSCGGVGFNCSVTANTLSKLPSVGQDVSLFTHLVVKEDALDLYAFAEKEELEFFKLLITVSGVGPKMALALLSGFTPDKLSVLIATGDSKSITSAPGVGPKLAQRITLELKDKVTKLGFSDDVEVGAAVGVVSASENSSDAVSALMALGYSKSEASLAVGKQNGNLDTEEIIKGALKLLMKNF